MLGLEISDPWHLCRVWKFLILASSKLIKIFHILIFVVEGVIGCLRSGRNCIASAPLPLKLFAQRRIPAMLTGCDGVEDEEEGTEANNDEN